MGKPFHSSVHAGETMLLYVEDDLINQEVLQHSLMDKPHIITYTAANLDEALGVLEDNDCWPDLIVLDNQLLIQEVWKALPGTDEIPLIMCTAMSPSEAVDIAKQAGALGYLCKPYTARDLVAIIALHAKRSAITAPDVVTNSAQEHRAGPNPPAQPPHASSAPLHTLQDGTEQHMEQLAMHVQSPRTAFLTQHLDAIAPQSSRLPQFLRSGTSSAALSSTSSNPLHTGVGSVFARLSNSSSRAASVVSQSSLFTRDAPAHSALQAQRQLAEASGGGATAHAREHRQAHGSSAHSSYDLSHAPSQSASRDSDGQRISTWASDASKVDRMISAFGALGQAPNEVGLRNEIAARPGDAAGFRGSGGSMRPESGSMRHESAGLRSDASGRSGEGWVSQRKSGSSERGFRALETAISGFGGGGDGARMRSSRSGSLQGHGAHAGESPFFMERPGARDGRQNSLPSTASSLSAGAHDALEAELAEILSIVKRGPVFARDGHFSCPITVVELCDILEMPYVGMVLAEQGLDIPKLCGMSAWDIMQAGVVVISQLEKLMNGLAELS